MSIVTWDDVCKVICLNLDLGHLHLLMKSILTNSYGPERVNFMHVVLHNQYLNKIE